MYEKKFSPFDLMMGGAVVAISFWLVGWGMGLTFQRDWDLRQACEVYEQGEWHEGRCFKKGQGIELFKNKDE